jgi:hypothetical protein
MKTFGAIALAALALVASQISCCSITLPDIDIDQPALEVGEMHDDTETVDLGEVESVTVRLLFGAGDLTVEPGEPDRLLYGRFRYNVDEWKPEITFQDDLLSITQGNADRDRGWPLGNAHNEWQLAFSPDVPIEMNVDVGAGDAEFDLSGLEIEQLDLDLGAGNIEIRFDEPNEADLGDLNLNAGATKLEMTGIGNAGPRRARIQGGVGDIDLGFAGEWTRSAEIDVVAGFGDLTLRLPDDVGVRVEVEGGLANVDASGLRRSGGAYVNDLYGEAEIELDVTVTAGVGQVTLIEVPND